MLCSDSRPHFAETRAPRSTILVVLFFLVASAVAHAGQRTSSLPSYEAGGGAVDLPFPIVGPPPPVPPEVVTRDASGLATIRAIRLETPLHIDGDLDEAIYSSTLPVSGFIQNEPHAGQPATEQTEMWIFFDN